MVQLLIRAGAPTGSLVIDRIATCTGAIASGTGAGRGVKNAGPTTQESRNWLIGRGNLASPRSRDRPSRHGLRHIASGAELWFEKPGFHPWCAAPAHRTPPMRPWVAAVRQNRTCLTSTVRERLVTAAIRRRSKDDDAGFFPMVCRGGGSRGGSRECGRRAGRAGPALRLADRPAGFCDARDGRRRVVSRFPA